MSSGHSFTGHEFLSRFQLRACVAVLLFLARYKSRLRAVTAAHRRRVSHADAEQGQHNLRRRQRQPEQRCGPILVRGQQW